MIGKNIKSILSELGFVLSKISQNQVDKLTSRIVSSKKIALVGAGRVGMATRAFAMRLKHLGIDAYMIGDSNVPSIGEGDLLIVSSGSGETQTIYDLAVIGKNNKACLALITGNVDSRIGKLADFIVEIKAPSKVKSVQGFKSVQPMTTLNEQCLFIFFDAVVLELMKKMKETHETMWPRHSNLE